MTTAMHHYADEHSIRGNHRDGVAGQAIPELAAGTRRKRGVTVRGGGRSCDRPSHRGSPPYVGIVYNRVCQADEAYGLALLLLPENIEGHPV